MKKNLILTAFLGLNLIGLYSCATGTLGSGSYGYLRTSVQFPERKFSLKVIPESTTTIVVKVTGEGLTNPIRFNLTRENPSRLLLDVPQGSKKVEASALNADGKTVAKGQADANVIAKSFNSVTVNLTEVAIIDQSPEPTPTASSSLPATTVTGKPSAEPSGTTTISGPSATPSAELPGTPSATPSGGTTEKCQIIINAADYPLTQTLEAAIREAGCDIIVPSATSSPSQAFTTGGSGNVSSGGGSPPEPSVEVNVADGAPVPAGIGLETPGP
jgi:hypothetical protein